MIYLPS